MRYRQILLLFTSLMLLFSCGKGLPDGVLSRKKMVPVLVDIHLAISYIPPSRLNIQLIIHLPPKRLIFHFTPSSTIKSRSEH